MTVTLAIITGAYRESNILGIGVAPNVDQTNEALERLQSLVASVFGKDVGENLSDWPVGVDNVNTNWPDGYPCWTINEWSYPRQNVRLLLNASMAQNIWLPKSPDNGARIRIVVVSQDLNTYPVTIHGNGRLVEGGDTLLLSDTATAPRVLFYDAERADWVRVEPITEDGQFPFPLEFDDYFITRLAMRINPRYGRALMAESGQRLSEMMQQIKARYRLKENMPADPAVLRLSDPNRWYGRFSRGRFGWMR